MGKLEIDRSKYDSHRETLNCYFKKPIYMPMKDMDLRLDGSFAKPQKFKDKLYAFLKDLAALKSL